MRKGRVIVGTIISILFVGIGFPIVYWYLIRLVNSALGLPPIPYPPDVGGILAGFSWSIGLFWIFWAYSYIVFVGAGSPVEAFGVALEPTTKLITAGPYAFVRNPLVFGFLFILLGVAFLANSIVGIVFVPLVGTLIAAYLLVFEEPELLRRFGVKYAHYRENVPMIVPRFSPYIPPEGEA